MKSIGLVILLFAVLLASGSDAEAQKRKARPPRGVTVDPTASILKLEGELMNAIRLKNANALAGILADDFVLRSPGQPEVGKADFIKGVTSIPVPILDVRGDGFGISVYGDVVILTGIQRVITRDTAAAPETSSSAFTDVFVKRNGRWWLTLAYGIDLPPAPGH